ncbi:hypothetical protein [Halovivax cerinus]|uniref:Uncharacterized protein n=1 Tax=Halovivax cerinus TaxID=1487865 RepID=A0ABD5NN81_9EURY|nr:hypothetical protein [Halovivax cerinus]
MTLVEYIADLLATSRRSPSAPERRESSRVVGPVSEPRTARSGGPDDDPESTIVYECRRCGTTVSSETSACPRCERGTIAAYPVS